MFSRFFKRHAPKTPNDWVREDKCPECHQETLLKGPRGGAARNVVCTNCLEEFVILSEQWLVDRNGQIEDERAKSVYGIYEEPMPPPSRTE